MKPTNQCIAAYFLLGDILLFLACLDNILLDRRSDNCSLPDIVFFRFWPENNRNADHAHLCQSML